MFCKNDVIIIDQIFDMVCCENNLNIIGYEDMVEVIKVASDVLISGHSTDQLQGRAALVLYLISFRQEFDLSFVWMNYWNIVRFYWGKKEIAIEHGVRPEILYRHIFNRVRGNIDINYNYRTIDNRDSDLAIILVSQFLGYKHAPSIRALDYSYAIQKYFNIRVMIINDSNFHFDIPSGTSGYQFNYLENYNDFGDIKYKDTSFSYYQNPNLMPDINSIIELCTLVYKLNPLFVYNIGGESFVADLCNDFTTVMCLPCSYDLPRTESDYLLIGRDLGHDDAFAVKELNPNQKVIETEINYVKADNSGKHYTRNIFNMGEKQFVICIVGNRLDYELTEIYEVLSLLADIDNVEIAFIGEIKDKAKIQSMVQNMNKIKFCGRVDDACELTALCDLYVNPKRGGGGRSAFEALANGVPVITLPYGDVYYTAGEMFAVESTEDMVEIAKKYMNDKLFYKEMSGKALVRAEELSNLKDTLAAAITKVMDYEREKEKNKGIDENGR